MLATQLCFVHWAAYSKPWFCVKVEASIDQLETASAIKDYLIAAAHRPAPDRRRFAFEYPDALRDKDANLTIGDIAVATDRDRPINHGLRAPRRRPTPV